LAAGLAAVLLPAGCIGLFEPATPQRPSDSGGPAVHVDYTTPGATLATLAAAISAKGLSNGPSAYLGGFADPVRDGIGFTMVFDPDVARVYETSQPGLPVPTWDLRLESGFYSSFIGLRTDPYALIWSPYEEHGNDDTDDPELAILHRRYAVVVGTPEGVFPDSIAAGIADLTLRLFGSRWAIVQWVDTVDPLIGAEPLNPDHRSLSYRRLENQ
jgi:hypothetical protein